MNRKKILFISGAFVFICLLAWLIFFLVHKKKSPVYYAVPQNATFIFDFPNMPDAQIQFTQNELWKQLLSLQPINRLQSDMSLMQNFCDANSKLKNDFTNQHILASALVVKSRELGYLFLIPLNDALRINLSTYKPVINNETPAVKVRQTEKEKIYDYTYKKSDIKFSCAKVYGIFIFSTSGVLTENAIRQLKNGHTASDDNNFSSVYAAIEKENEIKIFINCNQLADYLNMFINNELFAAMQRLKNFASWIAVDVKTKDNKFILNGYASAADKSFTLQKLASATPSQSVLDEIIPANTMWMHKVNAQNLTTDISASMLDSEIKQQFINNWSSWLGNEWAYVVTETFDENYTDKGLLLLSVKYANIPDLEKFSVKDSVSYRSFPIYKLNDTQMLQLIMQSAVNKFPTAYFTYINNALIFSSSRNLLYRVIDNYSDGQTLKQDAEYNKLSPYLASTSNQFFFVNTQKAKALLKNYLIASTADKKGTDLMQKFNQIAFQFDPYKNIFILTGVIQYEPAKKQSTAIAWKTQTDYLITAKPSVIMQDAAAYLVVQDTSNTLYCISTGGNIKWKLQLPEKIIGQVNGVDFYGNTKSQLLFNTAHGIYLVNLNGELVEGFPISLTSACVNPLTVLKNSNSDYTMFIACANGNIYGFYKDGKPLPGWSPMKNVGTVTMQLAKFKSGKNENIIFSNASGKIFSINAAGNILSSFENAVPFKNPFIANKNENATFIINIDTAGNLISISADNKFLKKNIGKNILDAQIGNIAGNNENEIIYITSTQLVAQNLKGEKLFSVSIANNRQSKLNLFDFEGLDIIALYSGVTNEIYLLNSRGKYAAGFPVKGSADFVLFNAGGMANYMLSFTGSNNITTYRVE